MNFIINSLFFVLISAQAFAQTDLEQARINGLNSHNVYRSKHSAPALTLDNTINDFAQKYAKYLADNNLFQHNTDRTYGENLYYGCTTGTPDVKNAVAQASKSWYDEIKDYNFASPGFSSATGHFTALIWKSTTKIGFGVATGQKTFSGRTFNCVYVVANYSPAGNFLGKFPENVLSQ